MRYLTAAAFVAVVVCLAGCGGSDPAAQASNEIDKLCAACDVFVADIEGAKTGKEAAAAINKFGATAQAIGQTMQKIVKENPDMDKEQLKAKQDKVGTAMQKAVGAMGSLMIKFGADPDVQKAMMSTQKAMTSSMGIGK